MTGTIMTAVMAPAEHASVNRPSYVSSEENLPSLNLKTVKLR